MTTTSINKKATPGNISKRNGGSGFKTMFLVIDFVFDVTGCVNFDLVTNFLVFKISFMMRLHPNWHNGLIYGFAACPKQSSQCTKIPLLVEFNRWLTTKSDGNIRVKQNNPCVKSVRIRNFPGPYYSHSVRMREKTEQKNSEYGQFSRSEY